MEYDQRSFRQNDQCNNGKLRVVQDIHTKYAIVSVFGCGAGGG